MIEKMVRDKMTPNTQNSVSKNNENIDDLENHFVNSDENTTN